MSYFRPKMHQIRTRLWLPSRYRWKSSQRSPDSLAGSERSYFQGKKREKKEKGKAKGRKKKRKRKRKEGKREKEGESQPLPPNKNSGYGLVFSRSKLLFVEAWRRVIIINESGGLRSLIDVTLQTVYCVFCLSVTIMFSAD